MIRGGATGTDGTGRLKAAEARAMVERRLDALVPETQPPSPLSRAMRHALLAHGKRIRPLVVLLAHEEMGGDPRAVLDSACAVEMLHTASLVLDDLPSMDDATLRRGQPATHVAFGEDVAILAAIALLGRAFAVVAADPRLTTGARAAIVGILAGAVGPAGLAGGQLADLTPRAEPPGIDGLLDTNHLKTGILFVASVEIAAVAAAADERTTRRLREGATCLGQAFQLLDDLVDGTMIGGEDSGKTTLLSILGAADVRARIETQLESCLSAFRRDGELSGFLADLFASGRERVETRERLAV